MFKFKTSCIFSLSFSSLSIKIRECVGPALYAKYDKQLLSATLDKMQDITYCPRVVCGCPVMRENDEKMAVCPSCKHVFCVFCKMTYHGVEPCRLKNGKFLYIIVKYFFSCIYLPSYFCSNSDYFMEKRNIIIISQAYKCIIVFHFQQ